MLNISREVYGCSCTLRSRVLAKVGWRWTSLTEDLEIVLDLAASGYKTGYTEQRLAMSKSPIPLNFFGVSVCAGPGEDCWLSNSLVGIY